MNPHAALLDSLDKITSYAPKLDLSGTRVVLFHHLASLQTIIRFMGARVCDDNVLQQLTGILCNIVMNLDIEQPAWPFSQNDEQGITASIIHIKSQLSSLQPELSSSPIPTKDVDPARVTTYANGSSVHFHADHITGNIEGSFLSNNNIQFDADPAVRQGVDNLVERAIDAITIKKRKKFLDWISKLDFQATQIETFAKHSPGTGDWFFKKPEFVDWRDGKTKFLWCPGIPGAGKTILSSMIIDHLRSISGLAPTVVYIYCDYTWQSDQIPTQLLGSMLKQLVQYCPSISDHLLALHNRHSSQKTFPDVAELLTALKTETSFHEYVYIIVDALDECSEANKARELFLPTNSQGLWSLLDHIHLLITSRDILSISKAFNNKPRIYIEAHQDDLQTYIKGRVINDVKLKRLVMGDTMLEAEIVDQVILKAARMFLQARLHLDALASQLNRKGLRMALRTLPKGIMDSYDTAMARISAQGEAANKLALQVLYWLAYAQEPLSVKELQHAVAVSDDMTDMDFDALVHLDLLTDICAGLVIVKEGTFSSHIYWHGKKKIFFDLSDHSSPVIQLVHYTTYEYFQLKQHQLFPNIHPLMAMTCLTYMSFDAFNSDDITLAIWKQHPLYRYAVLHWAKHAQQDEAAVFQHILKFFDKKTSIPFMTDYGLVYVKWRVIGKSHILMLFGLHQTLEIMLLKDATYAHELGEHGVTPLAYACRNGHINVVQLLLSREDINSRSINTNPGNPFLFAVQHGNMDIVKLLLQQSDINTTVQDAAWRTPLSYAAENGNLEIVKLLLHRKDMTFIRSDGHQRTPFSYAAENGHLEIVKLLLHRKDMTFISSDKHQRTPLSYAAKNGHLEIVKLLLQWKDTTFTMCDKDQRTPLSYAVEKGYSEIVELLLQWKDMTFTVSDKYQRTPLSYAAAKGHLDIIKILLQQSDIDPNGSIMKPLLTFAAYHGHLDVVQLLLAHKDINVNASDTDQITSLGYAARNGHFNIAKILVQEPDIDLSPTDHKQRTPLSYAAEKGHIDIVELLLQHDNVNPGACDKYQRPSLSYAAEGGHTHIVDLLLEQKDVDLNSTDKEQQTPLAYAAKQNHVEVVKLLLQCETINPDASGQDQKTPLAYAAQCGHSDIVRLLLQREDVDPDSCDINGRTPLSHAAEKGSLDIIKCFLEQKHVDFNTCDKDYYTPLFYAVRRGHVDIVRLLVAQKGVDPNLPDKEHQTPLVYAAEWGQFDVVQVLIKYSNQIFINNALSIAVSKSDDLAHWTDIQENYLKIVKLLQEHATDN